MKRFYLCAILLLISGCRPADPICIGLMSPTPEQPWIAEPYIERPCIEDSTPAVTIQDNKQLPIAELINIALQNNPLTARAWSEARSAAANYNASQSTLYPSIYLTEAVEINNTQTLIDSSSAGGTASGIAADATATGDNILTGGSGGGTSIAGGAGGGGGTNDETFYTLNLNLSLTYLLLDFGGRDATIDSARQALFAANWNHQQTIQNVILSVLQAYFNYLQSKANMEARELDLKDAETNLDAAQKLFEAGINTRIDVLLAQSQLANTRLDLENLRGQVKTSLAGLATSLGLPANTFFKVRGLPDTLPVQKMAKDMNTLMENALHQRADLAAAYADYQRREADLRVAESAGLPTLSAIGNFNRTDFWSTSIKKSQTSSAGLQIDYPLFQGYYYENKVRQAEADLLTSYEIFKQVEYQVLYDVVSNYYAVQTAIESLKYSEEFLKYSQEAYSATLSAYRAGTQTFLDVVATQGSLARARAQNIQTKIQWVNALAALAYATGILEIGKEQIQLSPLYRELNRVGK